MDNGIIDNINNTYVNDTIICVDNSNTQYLTLFKRYKVIELFLFDGSPHIMIIDDTDHLSVHTHNKFQSEINYRQTIIENII